MVICPSCGGENLARFDRCFLCDQPLDPKTAETDNPWAAPPAERQPSQRTFTLGSLMLVIALIAVCLGVLVEMPGLGVILLLVSTPALIRTLLAVSRQKTAGHPLAWYAKVEVFVGSLGVVSAIGLCSLIVFATICMPAGYAAFAANNAIALVIGIAGGLAAAGTIAFYMIRHLWPWRVR